MRVLKLNTCILHTYMQAYQLGYKYPKYLFLTYGSYESQWWASYNDEVLCTPTELAEVLQFSLAALHFPSRLDGTESPNVNKTTLTNYRKYARIHAHR